MINFTGGLLKIGNNYINPNQVLYFNEGVRPNTTKVHIAGWDPFFAKTNVENFTDYFLAAQNTDKVIDVNA